ncbi:hypothetical protein Krac_1013 [Ktedonobacter racemifer DSM 44963]|uniref:Uncharacterized protein n=1 Tax=Ktedonobacter racemifer DSM 44963 TaxID=485913 RepID=D6U608_KTERA|nr:hypothetical protein Krac_1013 [Ktedonobacter racemifer DSM 44963]
MRNAYLHEAVRNWKAVCGETRKHGLGRDGRKRSARNLAYRLLYNILMRFLARRGPHARLAECGVLQATQSGVGVMEASCEEHVQQLNLFDCV